MIPRDVVEMHDKYQWMRERFETLQNALQEATRALEKERGERMAAESAPKMQPGRGDGGEMRVGLKNGASGEGGVGGQGKKGKDGDEGGPGDASESSMAIVHERTRAEAAEKRLLAIETSVKGNPEVRKLGLAHGKIEDVIDALLYKSSAAVLSSETSKSLAEEKEKKYKAAEAAKLAQAEEQVLMLTGSYVCMALPRAPLADDDTNGLGFAHHPLIPGY
jgi:hypothetical protein